MNVQLQKKIDNEIIDLMPVTTIENVKIGNDKLTDLIPSDVTTDNHFATEKYVSDSIENAGLTALTTVSLTKEEFDALQEKNPNVLYVITM